MPEIHTVSSRTSHLRMQQAKITATAMGPDVLGGYKPHRVKSLGLALWRIQQRSNRMQIGVQHGTDDQSDGVMRL
jgi:hypothetical protein